MAALSSSSSSTQQQQQQGFASVVDNSWCSDAEATTSKLGKEGATEEAIKAAAKMAKKQRQKAKKQQQQQQQQMQSVEDQDSQDCKDGNLLEYDQQGTGESASQAPPPDQDRLHRLSLSPLDMHEQASSAQHDQPAEADQASQHAADTAVNQQLSPVRAQTMACGQLKGLQVKGEQRVQSELGAALEPSAQLLGDQAIPDLLCCPLTKVTARQCKYLQWQGISF